MKQLELPLPTTTTRFERAMSKASEIIDYARNNPGDVMLALMTVLLLDIENDLDDLES